MKENNLNIPDHNNKTSGQQTPPTANEIFDASEFNAIKNKINSLIANHRAKTIASQQNMPLPVGEVFHITGNDAIESFDDTDLEGGEFFMLTFEQHVKFVHDAPNPAGAKFLFSCGHNFTPDPERDYLLLQYHNGAFHERNGASLKEWQFISDIFPTYVSNYQFNITDEALFDSIRIFDAIMHEHSGQWHHAMVIAKGAFATFGQVTIIGAPFDDVGQVIDRLKFAHNKVLQLPIAIADADFGQLTNDVLFSGATGLQLQIADCYILGYATRCVTADTGTDAKLCVRERASGASILTAADGLTVTNAWTYSYGLTDISKYEISGAQDLRIDVSNAGGNNDTEGASIVVFILQK